jgi:hypothetical protein
MSRWTEEELATRIASNPHIRIAKPELTRERLTPRSATTLPSAPIPPETTAKAEKPAIRKLALAMSEAELQANVRELARVRGWKCYHTYDSRKSDQGFPDLVLVRKNRLLFVELKSEKGKPSPAQLEWLHVLMLTRRVETFVWRPSSWLDGTVEGMLR